MTRTNYFSNINFCDSCSLQAISSNLIFVVSNSQAYGNASLSSVKCGLEYFQILVTITFCKNYPILDNVWLKCLLLSYFTSPSCSFNKIVQGVLVSIRVLWTQTFSSETVLSTPLISRDGICLIKLRLSQPCFAIKSCVAQTDAISSWFHVQIS